MITGRMGKARGAAQAGDATAADRIRRIILQQSKRANAGHIGSALSIADVVAALYEVMRLPEMTDPNRDRFILSKGHAALAVYAALHLKGWLSEEQLDCYCANGTLLGVHPEHELGGIEFSTGSLGHGLPIGVGAALAARLQGSDRRVFVLLSDAECNEGSVWEAAMLAAHHRLGNLTAILDLNGQQALGYTREVLDLGRVADRWKAFGWHPTEVDGHDSGALAGALAAPRQPAGSPKMIVARTVFGKGVSFMENQIKWHYLPMDDAQYAEALAEVGGG